MFYRQCRHLGSQCLTRSILPQRRQLASTSCLTSTYGCAAGRKSRAPALIASEGSMIFTLSNAAWYLAVVARWYTASKHAVPGLIRQLAYELAPKVRVNGVGPCGMASDRGPQALGQSEPIMQSLTPEKIA
ncbi:SDR family oxidoreductase [Shigella flexneri]